MNILLLHNRGIGNPGLYLERSLRKKHHVITENLNKGLPLWLYDRLDKLREPFRTKYFHIPPIYRHSYFLPPLKIPNLLRKIQERLDFIFLIDSGDVIARVKDIEKVDIPTAFWAIDVHYELKTRLRIASKFKYTFVAQKDFVEKFRAVCKNVFWLPYACDPEIYKSFQLPKIYDVGFVGCLDPIGHSERVRLLKKLSEKFNVHASANIFHEEAAKIYSQSKIVFNRSVRGDLNMRVFEVLSCGSMLLTDEIKNGLKDLFQNKKHLVLYNDEKELMELAQYYLENEEEREKIANQGMEEIHKKHTYDLRWDEVIKKALYS